MQPPDNVSILPHNPKGVLIPPPPVELSTIAGEWWALILTTYGANSGVGASRLHILPFGE